ncbi:polymorphic toxin-type HINT domain-containing protein [Nonomuraea sp. KM90]|uniref:polymorphic toxin-type HINT domain-containing protein n=1 Tax=Nonomuraea sp. KM90 TaxID=3457428 RepID=UPI003FCCEF75
MPGTKVLLADGSRKAIDGLRAGDQVIATDPATGRTAAKAVLKTITSKGVKRLVSIAVHVDGDQGGKTGTVVATDRHPIWVPEYDRWTDAGQLKPGMWLQTSAGTHVQITAIKHEVRHGQRVHNLSIADTHAYCTAAGQADLLVHNTGCGETYYRTMSDEHFETLQSTGRLPATSETFISPTQAFSEAYGGRLVEFTLISARHH